MNPFTRPQFNFQICHMQIKFKSIDPLYNIYEIYTLYTQHHRTNITNPLFPIVTLNIPKTIKQLQKATFSSSLQAMFRRKNK